MKRLIALFLSVGLGLSVLLVAPGCAQKEQNYDDDKEKSKDDSEDKDKDRDKPKKHVIYREKVEENKPTMETAPDGTQIRKRDFVVE